MTSEQTPIGKCEICDRSIPADAPGGVCPHCLIGIAGTESASVSADAHASINRPPSDLRCPTCHGEVPSTDTFLLICPECGQNLNLTEAEPKAPCQIGRFTVLEKLGAGQFGIVWKAHDPELDRDVAIKVPRSLLSEPMEIEAFMREARATAQLSHPNIARVHEVGRDDDIIYIVTDLIEGIPLDQWLEDHQLTEKQAATLCITIADALAHAHRHGIIHRDLKPGNILLDHKGQPHLVDFGLAKRNSHEITLTLEGKILGTPAYMPPEQAQGDSHQATERSDVYALGVILFQLLTGELPFRGNLRMVLHQVLNQDPPRPRKLNDHISKDLETVCLKCLEKAPNNRYLEASEVASELQSFLCGEPIVARPISYVVRLFRWCIRHRTLAAAYAIAGLAILATLASLALGYNQARRAKTEMTNHLKDAARNSHSVALDHLQSDRVLSSFAYLADACEFDPTFVTAAAQGFYGLKKLPHPALHPHRFPVYDDPNFNSPDHPIPRSTNTRVVDTSGQSANLRNAASGKLVAELHANHDGSTIVFSPDGSWIVSCNDNTVYLWVAESGNLIRRIPSPASKDLNGFAVSADSERLLVNYRSTANGEWSQMATLRDRSGNLIANLSEIGSIAPAFSGDGAIVKAPYVGNQGLADLELIRTDDPSEIRAIGDSRAVVAIVNEEIHIRLFDPSGKLVADFAESSLPSGDRLTSLKRRIEPLLGKNYLGWRETSFIISEVVKLTDYKLESPEFYSATTGKPLFLEEDSIYRHEICLKSDQRVLTSGERSVTLNGDRYESFMLWDAISKKLIKELDIGIYGSREKLRFCANGKNFIIPSAILFEKYRDRIAAQKNDNPFAHERLEFDTVLVDSESGELIKAFPTAGWLGGNDSIGLQAEQNTIYVWDLRTGKQSTKIICDYPVKRAEVSPDSRHIVTMNHTGTESHVWDLHSHEKQSLINGQIPRNPIRILASIPTFSSDGLRLSATILPENQPIHWVRRNKRWYTQDQSALFPQSAEDGEGFLASANRHWKDLALETLDGPFSYLYGYDGPGSNCYLLQTSSENRRAFYWQDLSGDMFSHDSADAMGWLVDHEALLVRALPQAKGWITRQATLSSDGSLAMLLMAPYNGEDHYDIPFEGQIRVWDMNRIKLVCSLPIKSRFQIAPEEVSVIRESPTSLGLPLFLSLSPSDREYFPWRTSRRDISEKYPVELRSDGDQLLVLTGTEEGDRVLLFNTLDGSLRATLRDKADIILGANYSSSGKNLITFHPDKVCIWDPDSGELTRTIRQISSAFDMDAVEARVARLDQRTHKYSFIWNQQSSLIQIVSREDKEILLGSWDPRSELVSIAVSPTREEVMTSSWKDLCVWDIQTGDLKKRLPLKYPIGQCMYSPNGNSVILFPLDASKEILLLTWDDKNAVSVALGELDVTPPTYSPDGQLILFRKGDELQVWDVTERSIRFRIHCPDEAQFDRTSKRIVIDGSQATWIPVFDSGIPSWTANFFRFASRQRISAEGSLENLPASSWTKLKNELQRSLENDSSVAAEYARWFLEPTNSRPLRPGSQWSQKEVADMLISKDSSEEQLSRAYELDPDHPLIHLALARYEKDPAVAKFLRQYSLSRLSPDVEATLSEHAKAFLKTSE